MLYKCTYCVFPLYGRMSKAEVPVHFLIVHIMNSLLEKKKIDVFSTQSLMHIPINENTA